MRTEAVTYICCSDIAGKLRGKGVPACDLDERLVRGVGWTPTNVQITCFDTIAESPYGALGDLALVPDSTAHSRIDFGDGGPIEDFVLGSIRHLDGRPWPCCTRSILQAALDRLEAAAGVRLLGAFEHEFHMPGRSGMPGEAFTVAGFRAERRFAEVLTAALRQAGMTPDTLLREYGADQFEVTVKPVLGMAIADQAAMLREIVRAVAERLGKRASFTPLRAPGEVGNGVHIHMSFRDAEGRPATYDPNGPHGLSRSAGAFVAGVLRHIGSIVAFTAPSLVSYQRLVPHRWSAAYDNLGVQDREAAVRICPVIAFDGSDPAPQFNFEYRAADAAASPHLQLAAIVHAGAAGIEDGLATPPATAEDLSLLSPEVLAARGLRRLPASLPEALDRLAADRRVRDWFPAGFVDVYLAHKRGEIARLANQSDAQVCAAYEQVY